MRHITQCLNPKLNEICQHAFKLDDINATLLSYLPDDLKPHCRVGSFHKGCLIIVTHDSVWASQLRYILPELRDKLRRDADLYQLASIKITINVDHTPASTPKQSNHNKPPSPWQSILNDLSG